MGRSGCKRSIVSLLEGPKQSPSARNAYIFDFTSNSWQVPPRVLGLASYSRGVNKGFMHGILAENVQVEQV